MKWPDLFIVGAPKCGTTAMTRFLEAHPEVQMAARKDLHFFGSDLGFRNRERIGEAEYLAHFHNDDSKRIRAESSVWYLYSERAASEIAACNPEARILILLRHPVEMMHALWAQLRLNGLGDEDITEFAEALAAERPRARRAEGAAVARRVGLEQPHRHEIRSVPAVREARGSRPRARFASSSAHAHQYMRPSYFSKYCCIASSSGEMARPSSSSRVVDDLNWLTRCIKFWRRSVAF